MARDTVEAEIAAIGSRGDGVAETAAGRYFVPFTVPGDRVRLAVRGGDVVAVERLSDGAGRRAPPCPHFGACGGCALQHVADEAYAAWKRDRVVEALARRGFASDVASPVRVAPGSRRRVRLGARSTATGVVLGFKARRSRRLVDVAECPVARPEIVALLAPLRAMLADFLDGGAAGEFSVTAADGGLDVDIAAAGSLDLARRERAARFAETSDLARLTWNGETVVRRRVPRAVFGGVAVGPPPGAFLQPTAEGEAALVRLVTEALSPAGSVADLFAGCGTFTFPLAMAGKRVRAIDSNGEQIAAVESAARASHLDGRIDAEARDLARRPLAGPELAALDGLVLDPPRAGAAAQAREIAAAAIPVVAYASCNPATFARDARILVDGGYRLEAVTPIDQFLFSAEVELIGVFRR